MYLQSLRRVKGNSTFLRTLTQRTTFNTNMARQFLQLKLRRQKGLYQDSTRKGQYENDVTDITATKQR